MLPLPIDSYSVTQQVVSTISPAESQKNVSNNASSKWAKIAERIKNNPVGLGEYTQKFNQDLREAREDMTIIIHE